MSLLFWFKALPWRTIGIAAAIAVLVWYRGHLISTGDAAGYRRALGENAETLIQANVRLIAAERRAREASDNARSDTAARLAMVRGDYAARPDTVIRVCIPAPSSAGALSASPTASGRAASGPAASGSLQARAGQDTGTDFDPTSIYDLIEECDDLVEKYRGVELWDQTAF